MENAADALKMAAAVLIFVVALSISINAFTEVRKTSQMILDYNDREYDSQYIGENETETERIVSVESIVPTIYKAYAENYKIVFDIPGFELYKKYQKKEDGTYAWVPINYIDLEKEKLSSEFIKILLYGVNNSYTNAIERNKIKNDYKTTKSIELTKDNGIYDEIKNNQYIEKLGVYYQEDTYAINNMPTTNKNKKRIITYSEN